MVKDKNFLRKFKYLASDGYRQDWVSGNYKGYSKTHTKKIKNFWDTFEHYQFNKQILLGK